MMETFVLLLLIIEWIALCGNAVSHKIIFFIKLSVVLCSSFLPKKITKKFDFAKLLSLIEISFGITFIRQLRINPLKNVQRSTLLLLPCSILMIHYSYYIRFIILSVFLLLSFLFFLFYLVLTK